jgi:hypothetical protein
MKCRQDAIKKKERKNERKKRGTASEPERK